MNEFKLYIPIISTIISALISAGIAWFTVQRSFRTESNKLKLGVQQKLMEQLVSARLLVYPQLYLLLSELVKEFQNETISSIILSDTFNKIEAWDSHHAILLGPDTSNTCYDFRQALRNIINIISETNIDDKTQVLHELFLKVTELELALRSDIGVYGIELEKAPNELSLPKIKNY